MRAAMYSFADLPPVPERRSADHPGPTWAWARDRTAPPAQSQDRRYLLFDEVVFGRPLSYHTCSPAIFCPGIFFGKHKILGIHS